MSRRVILSILAPLAVAVPSLAYAQGTISTQATINTGATSAICCWGEPATQTMGQTFQTPDAINTQIQQFTFYVMTPPQELFKAYLYAWNGSHAVGPQLFASAVMFNPTGGNYQVVVNTGDITLLAGQEYVAFLSTSGTGSALVAASWSYGPSTYAQGAGVWTANGDDINALTTTTWENYGQVNPGDDAKFTAQFAGVTTAPEPASLTLMATGLLGMAGFVRRRRPSPET